MELKAILGLGNTGSKYKNTYHNVGHQMIDFLIEKNIFPEKIMLIKNEGFMNESGSSALKILKKSGSKPENLLVIQDDSDIALGKYKLSIDRTSAGHKGIQDIINKIGSKNFWRLRIGIRPIEENNSTPQSSERVKALDFVLKNIKKENKEILKKVFEEAASILTQPPQ
ncbi:MAG: aminoacyl-tRNA hydrolase [Minisyncoccota bacterium]